MLQQPRNVLGEPLQCCCKFPMTGFYRDGTCRTSAEDIGQHTVCVQITEEFLQFSKEAGNDLSTPHPELDFPGLQEGDRWCLCALRWLEAYQNGSAPKVVLSATEESTLNVVPLNILKEFSVDESIDDAWRT